LSNKECELILKFSIENLKLMEAEVLTPTGKSDSGARKSGVAFYPYYKTFPFLKEKINKELIGEINVKGFDLEYENSEFQFKTERSTRRNSKQFFDVVLHRDLIVQEAMRLILKAVFEGNFSAYSHSFQSFKGKHTALQEISFNFGGATWVLEGEINECFDAFDYKILIEIIALRIQDTLFLELICKCFKSGYINLNFIVQAQSANIFFTKDFILIPILFNIYFDLVDKWIENRIKVFGNQKQRYTRFNYVRYASNFLIAVHGSKKDCFLLKTEFLRFLINKLKINKKVKKIVRYLPNNK
jgi:hypothetical protein